MAGKINPFEQNQWEAGPNEDLKIPEGYITGLQYEIVVQWLKKTFTFRCRDFKCQEGNVYKFEGVIIDTSKRNPKGEVELMRITYHPELILANIGFMVVPAPEKSTENEVPET